MNEDWVKNHFLDFAESLKFYGAEVLLLWLKQEYPEEFRKLQLAVLETLRK